VAVLDTVREADAFPGNLEPATTARAMMSRSFDDRRSRNGRFTARQGVGRDPVQFGDEVASLPAARFLGDNARGQAAAGVMVPGECGRERGGLQCGRSLRQYWSKAPPTVRVPIAGMDLFGPRHESGKVWCSEQELEAGPGHIVNELGGSRVGGTWPRVMVRATRGLQRRPQRIPSELARRIR